MAYLVPTYEVAAKIGRRLEFEASTVGELLDRAIAQHGEQLARATKSALIVVNGVAINSLRGRKTPLTADDEVWLVKAAGGG